MPEDLIQQVAKWECWYWSVHNPPAFRFVMESSLRKGDAARKGQSIMPGICLVSMYIRGVISNPLKHHHCLSKDGLPPNVLVH